jgi:hypothetical protein
MRTRPALTAGPGRQPASLLTCDMLRAAALAPAGHASPPLGISLLTASRAARLISMSGGITAGRRNRCRRPGTCSVPGIAGHVNFYVLFIFSNTHALKVGSDIQQISAKRKVSNIKLTRCSCYDLTYQRLVRGTSVLATNTGMRSRSRNSPEWP